MSPEANLLALIVPKIIIAVLIALTSSRSTLAVTNVDAKTTKRSVLKDPSLNHPLIERNHLKNRGAVFMSSIHPFDYLVKPYIIIE